MQTAAHNLVIGKEYDISFWYKGNAMKIAYTITYSENFPDGVEVDGAGAEKHQVSDVIDLQTVPAWAQYRKAILMPVLRKEDIGQQTKGTFGMTFIGPGEAWIDEVILIERKSKP